MPRRRLTLTVDEAALRNARLYAERHGTSVSALVSAFLTSLEDPDAEGDGPIVSSLRGILPPTASRDDYRRHLIEKYEADDS